MQRGSPVYMLLTLLSVTFMCVSVVFVTWSDAPGAAPDKKAEIGSPAPEFELKDVYSNTFKLSNFKDKIVVLEWINKNCPVSEAKHRDKTMQNTYKDRADRGVVWLAIDTTANAVPDENRIYAAKMGLAYPILHDPDGKVGRLYGAQTTPHMFVIDKKGNLAYDGAIDNKDKINYVADAVDALLAGKPVSSSKTKPYGCGVKYKS